ncbi:MAG: WD40 repeat domain-containing protein, partial [Planctomycetaceae bacterium]|nr:WD40 repeat domain-containing protein [Planctomycetaceae bacterium]
NQFVVCVRGGLFHRLLILDADTLEQVRELEVVEHRKRWDEGAMSPGVTEIAVSPQGDAILTFGKYSDNNYQLTYWEAPDWKPQRAPESTFPPIDMARDPSIWGIVGKREFGVWEPNQFSVRAVKTWDRPALEADVERTHIGRCSMAITQDGIWVATGGQDGRVALWDTLNGRGPFFYRAHLSPVVGMTFSPSGDTLVTAGQDNEICIWSLSGHAEMKTWKAPKTRRTTAR